MASDHTSLLDGRSGLTGQTYQAAFVRHDLASVLRLRLAAEVL
jgi:hypothetical protein